MRISVFTSLFLVAFWVGAFKAQAAPINAVCFKKAAAAVKDQAVNSYDPDGIETIQCEMAPNNKAVICDVGAMKSGGAAADTYRVVLSSSCARVFRVELTGEE